MYVYMWIHQERSMYCVGDEVGCREGGILGGGAPLITWRGCPNGNHRIGQRNSHLQSPLISSQPIIIYLPRGPMDPTYLYHPHHFIYIVVFYLPLHLSPSLLLYLPSLFIPFSLIHHISVT